MAVGGVRGGGKKGGAGKAGGPTKAGGTGFAGKVDRAASTMGPSGAAESGNVQSVDPLTSQALEIARQLKQGLLSNRDEATRRLVFDILKQKLRMQSKALTRQIAQVLQDDPQLNQTLERLWSKG